MSAAVLSLLPVTVIAFALYLLRQLADALMLLYVTDQQSRVVICLLPPFGGVAFLILEQAR